MGFERREAHSAKAMPVFMAIFSLAFPMLQNDVICSMGEQEAKTKAIDGMTAANGGFLAATTAKVKS